MQIWRMTGWSLKNLYYSLWQKKDITEAYSIACYVCATSYKCYLQPNQICKWKANEDAEDIQLPEYQAESTKEVFTLIKKNSIYSSPWLHTIHCSWAIGSNDTTSWGDSSSMYISKCSDSCLWDALSWSWDVWVGIGGVLPVYFALIEEASLDASYCFSYGPKDMLSWAYHEWWGDIY